MKKIFFLVLFLLSSINPCFSNNTPDIYIPDQLKPWAQWVLYEQEKMFCPGLSGSDTVLCNWESYLQINIFEKKGEFILKGYMAAPGYLYIPGNFENWPISVTLNGENPPVIKKDNNPALFVKKGDFVITGVFNWERPPASVTIPNSYGIAALTMENKTFFNPIADNEGRIWLVNSEKKPAEKRQDYITASLYRLFSDDIPMQHTTRLELDVSGSAREMEFRDLLLENSVLMRLNSPLTAKFDKDKILKVKVKPGRWVIEFDARFSGNPSSLAYKQLLKPLPETEIWSFKENPQIRSVEISGGQQVDPQYVKVPGKWHGYPAFQMSEGKKFEIIEKRRGEPVSQPNDLRLFRTIWLDFNGQGFTFQDKISGQMNNGWRLSLGNPLQLGRLSVNNADRILTLDKYNGVGAEIRQKQLNVTAVSRINSTLRDIPASGWNYDMKEVSCQFNTPPGWLLLWVSGADNVTQTWLGKWRLIDIFLVLVITGAVIKLFGFYWGGLAFVFMALSYIETGAPRWIWLNVIISIVLLNVVKGSIVRQVLWLWKWLSLLTLFIISISFIYTQALQAIYPQIQNSFSVYQPAHVSQETSDGAPHEMSEFKENQAADMSLDKLSEEAPNKQYMEKRKVAPAPPLSAPLKKPVEAMLDYEREFYSQNQQKGDILIPTGPGVPNWNWNSHQINFAGPVKKDHKISLYLIDPISNSIICWLRIFFLLLLIARFLTHNIEIKNDFLDKFSMKTRTASIIFFSLFTLLAPVNAFSETFPSADILSELQNRLLKAPECLDNCADISTAAIDIIPEKMNISMQIHADAMIAYPLPCTSDTWMAEEVLLNKKSGILSRDKSGRLFILLAKGINHVELNGHITDKTSIDLPFFYPAHNVALNVQKPWQIDGIDKNGNEIKNIRISKVVSEEPNIESGEMKEETHIDPYLSVERTIYLDFDWKVRTTLRRLTPTGEIIVTKIPLIENESVITDGIKIEDNNTIIQMPSNQKVMTWESTLPKKDKIILKAADSKSYSEIFIVQTSPLYRIEYEGLAPLFTGSDLNQVFAPKWKPRPGESVLIKISKPEPVTLQSLTIDKVDMEISPGNSQTGAKLLMNLRTSKGGKHNISLPPNTEVRKLKINNMVHPVQIDDKELVLSLTPGANLVEIEWIQDEKISERFAVPDIKLQKNEFITNISLKISVPKDRWILFTSGPVMGPGVLFWIYAVVVVLLGFCMGRLDFTPLKTHHWILLGLGLTQTGIFNALIVVLWPVIVGLRKDLIEKNRGKISESTHASIYKFDLLQIFVVFWTILTFFALIDAIRSGLIGFPDMNIRGNSSEAYLLKWYADRSFESVFNAGFYSVHIFIYRGLMLLWALWLAFSVIKWVMWGWENFSFGGAWKNLPELKRVKIHEKGNGKDENGTTG